MLDKNNNMLISYKMILNIFTVHFASGFSLILSTWFILSTILKTKCFVISSSFAFYIMCSRFCKHIRHYIQHERFHSRATTIVMFSNICSGIHIHNTTTSIIRFVGLSCPSVGFLRTLDRDTNV